MALVAEVHGAPCKQPSASQKKDRGRVLREGRDTTLEPLRDWNAGSASTSNLKDSLPAAEAYGAPVAYKIPSASPPKVDFQAYKKSYRQGKEIIDFGKAVREGRETMEGPLHLKNATVMYYLGMLSSKEKLVVVPEDTIDIPLSEEEMNEVTKQFWFRVWRRSDYLEKGPYPSNRLKTDKKSITVRWHPWEPATFDILPVSSAAVAFKISSFDHDLEDVYDINPSYGLLFASSQTIQVSLKKSLPPGFKDSLLIESFDASSFLPIFTGYPIRRCQFLKKSLTHNWVQVDFGSPKSEEDSKDKLLLQPTSLQVGIKLCCLNEDCRCPIRI